MIQRRFETVAIGAIVVLSSVLAVLAAGGGPDTGPRTLAAAAAHAPVDPGPDAPPEAKLDYTLAVLAGNYAAKQGGAGGGLAHHFLNLGCSSADAALHSDRCPDGPYPASDWAGEFSVEVLYLTARDVAGGGATDIRVVEFVLYSSGPACEPRLRLCGGDLATIAGVVDHFVRQLAPYFEIVIEGQLDRLMDAAASPQVLAALFRDLRGEHRQGAAGARARDRATGRGGRDVARRRDAGAGAAATLGEHAA